MVEIVAPHKTDHLPVSFPYFLETAFPGQTTGHLFGPVVGIAQKTLFIKNDGSSGNPSDLPVGVGFGIKDAETAKAVSRVADAVVVGSALVSRVEALADRPEEIATVLTEVLVSMRNAMDGG